MNRPSAPILARLDQRAGLIAKLLERWPIHDLLAQYESAVLERPQQTDALLASDLPFRHYVDELVLCMDEMIVQLGNWSA